MGISNYIPWVEYLQKKYPHIDPNNYNIDLQRILSDVITNLKILYCREKIEYNIHTRNTNLTSDNIYLERNFKLEVLEWLNNGKPKIFRSPTEGNYIVRLMNVSLSPTDSLNRMIHTFSCTAYEIAENN